MDRVSVHGGTSHVPAFLAKLWRIVDEPSTNDLICWSESGKSFIIRNQSKFARELLPLYYKHNNMASFVRQLNMYGFHKVISVEQGGLRLDRDEMEFAHVYFIQGNEDALEFIKRKISTSKIEDLKSRPESLNKVLIDVRQMKGRQEAMDSKLVAVKRENEALWRELSQLRQKHSKQQQIVTKLLQFLVSMMSSQSHRISFKRRMPLMLNDAEGNTKPAKLSRPNKTSVVETSVSNGPVIHEVFESEEPTVILSIPDEARNEQQPTERGMDSDLLRVEDLLHTAVSETIGSPSPAPSPITITAVQEGSPVVVSGNEQGSESSPGSPQYVTDLFSIQTLDSNSGSPLPITTEDMAAIGMTSEDIIPAPEDSMQLCRDDLDGHLDEVQLGLDSLKDLLQGTTYNIDSSTLSGVGSPSDLCSTYSFDSDTLRQLFGAHDNDFPLYELTRLDNTKKEREENAPLGITFGEDAIPEGGSDVASYNPCLFELAEEDSHFFENPSDNIFLDDELDMMLTTDRNKLIAGGELGLSS